MRRGGFGVPGLKLEVERAGDGVVIRLSGDLDLFEAPRLRAVAQALIAEGISSILIDLRGVGFLDSAGISAIIGAFKRLRACGGTLALLDPEGRHRMALELIQLPRLVPVYASLAEALPGKSPREALHR